MVALAALVNGCCDDAEACPQNTVAVHVTEDGAPAAGVSVEGAGATWACAALDAETLCAPDSIADGRYVVIVAADGHAPRELELFVRTYSVPPYSCDCEIPTGTLSLDLAPASTEPDAG